MMKAMESVTVGASAWRPFGLARVSRLACCMLGAWLLAVASAYAGGEGQLEEVWLFKGLGFVQETDGAQLVKPDVCFFVTGLIWDELKWTPDEVSLIVGDDEDPYPMWEYEQGGAWYLWAEHETKSDLDNAFPSETAYKYIYSGDSVGPQELEVELGPDAYPDDIPYFTGDVYTRAQTEFDASSDFELSWNEFTPHADADFSFVEVLLLNPNTYEEIAAWELDHDATSITVPAGTLEPGTPYAMEIVFINEMIGKDQVVAVFEKWTALEFNTLADGMAPSDGVTVADRRPEFTWPAVAGATWYHVWINRDGETYKSTWVEDSTTWSPASDLKAGNYSWWVRSWNPADGHGPWSEAADFIIAAQVPAAPVPDEPTGTVQDTRRPTFSWSADEHATWYRLYVSLDGSAVVDRWIEGDATFTLDADLEAGTYRWWVVGWGADGLGPWSEAAEFVIESSIPSALTLLGPDGPQADATPTYRWEKDAHATWYRLWVGETGAETWHDRWYELAGSGEASVTPDGAPPGPAKPILDAPSGVIADDRPTFEWTGGAWEWWVRPWGPDGHGPWSGPMVFSIPYPPETWFRVYVNEGNTTVIDEWTQAAEWVPEGPLESGNYAWWVGVWDGATGRTIWSARRDFTVTSDMVLIPGGTNAGTDPDFGSYSLTVDSFYMDQYPVTKALWDEVYTWAIAHGYSFDNAGSGKAPNHPVHTVSWYDVVKWCNARSQMEGRPTVYTVNGSVYKTGREADVVQTTAAGYRLPTETEWEYAARGGLSSKRFPWGDTIQHSRANYYSDSYSYDTSPTHGYHPTYNDGTQPYTSPVGSFAANGYGLYDMAGNVWEWCFSAFSSYRAIRGGRWDYNAYWSRVGYRDYSHPDFGWDGFRTVLPPGQ